MPIDSRKLTDPMADRKLSGMNQSTYWSRFGITQSGGSRFEGGRGIPLPVALLMALHAAGKITDDDLAQARSDVESSLRYHQKGKK